MALARGPDDQGSSGRAERRIEALKPEAPKSEAGSSAQPDMPKIGAPAIDPAIEITQSATADAGRARKRRGPAHRADMDEPKPSAQQPRSAPAMPAARRRRGHRAAREPVHLAGGVARAGGGARRHGRGARSLRPGSPGSAPRGCGGRTDLDEIQALKENVVQARVELAALKVEHRCRPTATPTRSSPGSASASSASSALRPSRRPSSTKRSRCSIAFRAATRPATEGRHGLDRAAARERAEPRRRNQGVEGWVVRDVHRGTALIEGRMGIIEVEQGDLVPGLGRVDAIRKQDGRWVVVTSQGPHHVGPLIARARLRWRSGLQAVHWGCSNCGLNWPDRGARPAASPQTPRAPRWRRDQIHGNFCAAQRASGHAPCLIGRGSPRKGLVVCPQ